MSDARLLKRGFADQAEAVSKSDCRSVTVSGNGKLIATGDTDGYIKLWSYANGRVMAPLVYTGHVGAVNRLEFDNRGYHLLSVGMDGHIMLWTVRQPAALPPPTPTVAPRSAAPRAMAAPEPEPQPVSSAGSIGPPKVAYLDPQTLLCCGMSSLSITDLETGNITKTIESARSER